MKTIIIDLPKDLTSFEFYNNIVMQQIKIEENNKKNDIDEIIFDFSKTIRIEPLVIPNLLCLGYRIRKNLDKIAMIYMPNTNYSGLIKNYLNEIEFINYVEKYKLFTFNDSPYNGLEGKKIDPLCGTLYFDLNYTQDEIRRGIDYYVKPFTESYLADFNAMFSGSQGFYYGNEIAEFLEEIITNCNRHARSFSFTTLHAKHSTKMIYISVSDYGCGFGKTVNQDNVANDEVKAIFTGIYKRRNSRVYGLYNVIRRVLELKGKVRIHSKDSQVIFTPRILDGFLNNTLLVDESFKKYNIKSDIPFKGVHIEIELPLEREA